MCPKAEPSQARRSLDGITASGRESSAADPSPKQEKNRLLFWKFFVAVITFAIFALSNPLQSAPDTNFTPGAILQVINQDRANRGVPPLRLNVSLRNAAKNKADDMFNQNYFAHTSPGGLKPWDFIKQEKISYAYAGENLAQGYTNAYELENDMLSSPSHRENLLSPIFSEIGIAVESGEVGGERTVITVQMFASPADAVAAISPGG